MSVYVAPDNVSVKLQYTADGNMSSEFDLGSLGAKPNPMKKRGGQK